MIIDNAESLETLVKLAAEAPSTTLVVLDGFVGDNRTLEMTVARLIFRALPPITIKDAALLRRFVTSPATCMGDPYKAPLRVPALSTKLIELMQEVCLAHAGILLLENIGTWAEDQINIISQVIQISPAVPRLIIATTANCPRHCLPGKCNCTEGSFEPFKRLVWWRLHALMQACNGQMIKAESKFSKSEG